MDIIVILRISVAATFLILAIGGPVAIVQLRRFMSLYYLRHGELLARVEMLERRVSRLESKVGNGQP